MYTFFVGLHNLLRWIVVLGGVAALVTSIGGLLTRATWSRAVQISGLAFTSALGLQLVLGLGLYVVGPYLSAMISDSAAVMADSTLRFFAVEHITIMILAFAAAQLGYSLAKRAATDRAKYTRATWFYLASAALIAFGIPWWRSLIPWG